MTAIHYAYIIPMFKICFLSQKHAFQALLQNTNPLFLLKLIDRKPLDTRVFVIKLQKPRLFSS